MILCQNASENDQEKPNSQTTDQPTALRGRDTALQQPHDNNDTQRDDCKTRKDIMQCIIKQGPKHKVERKAKIRKRYNQVPNLTRNNIWESNKIQDTTTHMIAKSSLPSRRPQGTDKTEQQRQTLSTSNKNDSQKNTRPRTASKTHTH